MIRVLFVCLGNICRSPMAEAVLRHKIKAAGLEEQCLVDSAGTSGWHTGQAPHRGTQAVLKQREIDVDGIFARQVHMRDLTEFDYILAMDTDNLESLRMMASESEIGKIRLLLDYVPELPHKAVPDPYYTGNFEEVYRLIDQACDRFLEHVREKRDRDEGSVEGR